MGTEGQTVSRLLSHVSEAGKSSAALVTAKENELTGDTQESHEWLSGSQRWIVLAVGILSIVLATAIVVLWLLEWGPWKRKNSKKLGKTSQFLKSPEATLEDTGSDIESPTKKRSENIEDKLSWQHNMSNSDIDRKQSRPPPLQLPPIVVRRSSSIRSTYSGNNSPRLLSVRHRHSHFLRRRHSSSLCSPKSPHAGSLTVDVSVKARDISQVGWAVNPHATRAFSSGASSPTSPFASSDLMTYSPRLEYRIGAMVFGTADYPGHPTAPLCSQGIHPTKPEAPGHKNSPQNGIERNDTCSDSSSSSSTRAFSMANQDKKPRRHRLAQSGSAFDKESVHERHGIAGSADEMNDNVVPKSSGLIRYPTDTGLMDFKLSTFVADKDAFDTTNHGSQNESTIEGSKRQCTSGSEINGSSLYTATSIVANEFLRAIQDDAARRDTQEETKSTSATTLGPFGVVLLTPEQLAEEVRLDRLLGTGAAGSVHAGVWCRKPVAVKILHPSRQSSPSGIEAFRREVEVMALVGTHPNCLSVLGACLMPPHMAIITELAEHGSLGAAIHDEGLRPRYGTLLKLAEDIAGAMSHCHSLRLVHRDLKTHNVLLGADGRAIIADFGLAAAKNRTFLTLEPGALGTASVMAPEQFSAGQVDERCDVYAFGCLLWECITGRQPWYEMDNVMQIVMAVGCERRRPPIPRCCPPPVARLIKECWRHTAGLRPGFKEILERIKRLRAEEAAAQLLQRSVQTRRAALKQNDMEPETKELSGSVINGDVTVRAES